MSLNDAEVKTLHRIQAYHQVMITPSFDEHSARTVSDRVDGGTILIVYCIATMLMSEVDLIRSGRDDSPAPVRI
jgi:hypothetical protein